MTKLEILFAKLQSNKLVFVKLGAKGRIHIKTAKKLKNMGRIYLTKKGISWSNKFDGVNWETRVFKNYSELEAYLETHLKAKAIRTAVKTAKKIMEEELEVEVKKPEIKKPVRPKIKTVKTDFIETNKEVAKVIYGIENNKNILLKGETGCGKSFLIDELAKHYNQKVYVVSCDVELDKSEIIGKYEVINKKTVWFCGILIKAMEEGAWIVLDEVNMTRAEIMSVLHAVLDYRRKIIVKEHNNEEITAHENFRMFACMNPNYTGTADFNFAFRRRWNTIIKVDYLPAKKEVKLLVDRTNIDKETAEKFVQIANDVRKMAEQGKVPPISTAHLLEMSEMYVKTDFTVLEIAELTLNVSDDFGEMEDILHVVQNYF